MIKQLLITVGLLFSLTISAQNIAKDSILKVGFYKNIQELIDNSPSIPFNYTIYHTTVKPIPFNKNEILLYRLEIDKNAVKQIGDVYGFSDVEDIYLKTLFSPLYNFNKKKFNKNSDFIKVKTIGMYLYFKDIGESSPFNMSLPIITPYVINTKNGEKIQLTSKASLQLFQDDLILLEKFEKENHKEKNIQNYISEYNERVKADSSKTFLSYNELYASNKKSSHFIYSAIIQYGGESKLTLLPKIGISRIHNLKIIKPYYGVELGVLPMLNSANYTAALVSGLDVKSIVIESSLNHFRTSSGTSYTETEKIHRKSLYQNSLNLKLGYKFNLKSSNITMKFGKSILLGDNVNAEHEKLSLFDIGKIKKSIYGIELQFSWK